MSKSEICAYSDGSSEGNGRSAWGFVLKRNGQTLLTGSGIRHGGEALDAEITGARKALEAALGLQSATQRVYLLMDSQQAINALETGNSTTSLEEVRKFRELSKSARVIIKWVPEYSRIQSNLKAGSSVWSGLQMLSSSEVRPEFITLASLH